MARILARNELSPQLFNALSKLKEMGDVSDLGTENADQLIKETKKEYGSDFWIDKNFDIPRINEQQAILNNEYNPELNSWLKIYDEVASWFARLATLYTNENFDEDLQKQWQVFGLIAGNMTSHLLAIRQLVVSGHDVPAKQVLRGLIECTDLSVLLNIRRDLVSEFFKTWNNDTAKPFWRKHTNQAKKYINEKLATLIPDFKADDDWYKEEVNNVLSLCVHPSHQGSMNATIALTEGGEKEFCFLGLQSVNSIRTLRISIFHLYSYVFLGPNPFSPESSIYKFDDQNPLHVDVAKGREYIRNLISKCGNQDENILKWNEQPKLS